MRSEQIDQAIVVIQGCRALLDSDLAAFSGVTTAALNQAVARNPDRFPDDFMLQLLQEEWESLRSQSVISKGRGGRRYPPYVFTELGVAMLSSVLNSERAIKVNIEIMRAFVRLRHVLAIHHELAERLERVEATLDDHGDQIQTVIAAIRELMAKPESPVRRIGFRGEDP